MLIKITKELNDIPKKLRPQKGRIYKVSKIIFGSYNSKVNQRYLINSHGNTYAIARYECKEVKEEEK